MECSYYEGAGKGRERERYVEVEVDDASGEGREGGRWVVWGIPEDLVILLRDLGIEIGNLATWEVVISTGTSVFCVAFEEQTSFNKLRVH